MGAFDKLCGHIIDLNFTTHQSMIEAALLWNLKEYQLGKGTFKGYINAIHTSHIQLGQSYRSNGVLIKGDIPKNTYMFAIIESEGCITHNGLSVHPDELIILTEDDNIDYTASSSVSDITIAIDRDFFDAAFQTYFNKPFKYDKINKRIQLKENTGDSFISSTKELLTGLITQHTQLQNDHSFHTQTEYNILQIIFQNIDVSKQRKEPLESEICANEVRLYLEMKYKDYIHLNDLYTSEKFCARTIRLGFNNLFGFSPKQYLKCYRLGKIHHALLHNDFNSTSIANIAYDYGFNHMGRFSNNYKSMFGVTPSSTLKKSPPSLD